MQPKVAFPMIVKDIYQQPTEYVKLNAVTAQKA